MRAASASPSSASVPPKPAFRPRFALVHARVGPTAHPTLGKCLAVADFRSGRDALAAFGVRAGGSGIR